MSVSSLRTMNCTVTIPTTAICSPIPTIVANFTDFGITFIKIDDIPVTVNTHKQIPDIKHDVNASFNV